jgi:hypothetical protein
MDDVRTRRTRRLGQPGGVPDDVLRHGMGGRAALSERALLVDDLVL